MATIGNNPNQIIAALTAQLVQQPAPPAPVNNPPVIPQPVQQPMNNNVIAPGGFVARVLANRLRQDQNINIGL